MQKKGVLKDTMGHTEIVDSSGTAIACLFMYAFLLCETRVKPLHMLPVRFAKWAFLARASCARPTRGPERLLHDVAVSEDTDDEMNRYVQLLEALDSADAYG